MNAKSTAKILFILAFLIGVATVDNAYASETSGTIVSGGNNGYAWSGEAGWMNFGATNSNIQITDSGIMGFVWNDNYGWINMSPTNGGVTVAVDGALSGYAWGSSLGWINFSGVTINSLGKFVGAASGANIGTLTFDCTNCSVTTDFRAQNFRTVVLSTQVAAVSSGGSVGLMVSGVGTTTQFLPAHINAYNVPLQIVRTQSGTLTQEFINGSSAGVDVPVGIAGDGLVISATALNAGSLGVTIAVRAIFDTLFDVTARDTAGNPVRTFPNYIRIALRVPENMGGRSDIGVYYLDGTAGQWIRVPNVTFDGNIARFSVNHLTLFGIFVGETLPDAMDTSFKVPTVAIERGAEIGTFEEGAVPSEIESFLPAQLFDINLEIESTKIADVKNLIARLLFTSFGRVPTPVDITFSVVNKDGETVYSKKDTITVQTQAVLTERFSDIVVLVPAGKYTLLVTTLYNTDVRDEFKQDFEVTGEAIAVPFWRSLWFWVIGGLLLIFLFIIAIKKMGDDEEEGTSARKFSVTSSLLSARYMKDIRQEYESR